MTIEHVVARFGLLGIRFALRTDSPLSGWRPKSYLAREINAASLDYTRRGEGDRECAKHVEREVHATTMFAKTLNNKRKKLLYYNIYNTR